MDTRFDVSAIRDTDFDGIRKMLVEGVNLLEKKNAEYGASWCRRGGVGAFFTVWRKIDRLEEQLKRADFNMFDVSVAEDSTESIDETLIDAVLYFSLVLEKRKAIREELERRAKTTAPAML